MDKARSIGTRFLRELDDYLCENMRSITCNDIQRMYMGFFSDLKLFKGNATGFTGLSELLFFRFIHHLLGGSFVREPAPKSTDVYQFVSGADQSLVIGQSIRVHAGGDQFRPDIVIYHNRSLVAVCSIKVYLTSGVETVRTELAALKQLRLENPDMRALLVVYKAGSATQGKAWQEVRRSLAENEWFRYLALDGSDEPLHSQLSSALDLARFIPAAPVEGFTLGS